MFIVLIAFALIIAGLGIAKWGPFPRKNGTLMRLATVVGSLLVGVFLLGTTSFVFIEADELGAKKKIYASSSLKKGSIIAVKGESGYQADIIPPGFHVSPLINIINDVEKFKEIVIPKNFYGLIETTDGLPLPAEMVMAPQWPDNPEVQKQMLNATYFLTEGKGYKGLQSTVLKPGKYRVNPYLFKIRVANGSNATMYSDKGKDSYKSKLNTYITHIKAGHVGVVTSRVQVDRAMSCSPIIRKAAVADGGVLQAPLVPNGCKGVWVKPLLPGAYFMNREAFKVTEVDTRLQTWVYYGGYTSRSIALTVGEDGSLVQKPDQVKIPVPEGAADEAVDVKVEGWNAYQNLRALVQVSPDNAPVVVASVGGLKQVEDRVITPAIISEVRDVLGGTANLPDGKGGFKVRPVKILDLVENREALQREVDNRIRVHGDKAGVNIMEIRFGNPDIPPELLVARKREQLADQLTKATREEKKFQVQRKETENAKAVADQQAELVRANIRKQRAVLIKAERKLLGEGEKDFLTALADGEKARTAVLGPENVLKMNVVNAILETLSKNPELIKLAGKLVPNNVTIAGGGGGGLDLTSALAVFGGQMQQSVGKLPTNTQRTHVRKK